ncbi:thermonuclease family protein [Halioglobus maricola]|uniref:thermonuclease family protein n=1 Tax=Halioglobus maricola TaxID=2601894 RepID=UPI001478EDCC|nr:thermonuclease family protein [Halioglobus maricola]
MLHPVASQAADQEKRRFHASLALFLCLSLSGCDLSGYAAAPAPAPASSSAACSARDSASLRKVAVEHVHDGDTLRLRGGDRLRLVGVNTPELGRQGRADEPLAEDARRALQALTSSGHVWLEQGAEPRDRHGRLLAYAFNADGESLSAELLRRGMGFHVAISPNTDYAECLAAAESLARSASAGVWAESQFDSRPVRDLRSGQGGFALIRDEVTRVSFKDNGWWVQLGGKLGVKIRSRDQASFSRHELMALEGREVEVRGWIIPMDGDWWMLNLGHSTMLDPGQY